MGSAALILATLSGADHDRVELLSTELMDGLAEQNMSNGMGAVVTVAAYLIRQISENTRRPAEFERALSESFGAHLRQVLAETRRDAEPRH